jgi:hypothetical protein
MRNLVPAGDKKFTTIAPMKLIAKPVTTTATATATAAATTTATTLFVLVVAFAVSGFSAAAHAQASSGTTDAGSGSGPADTWRVMVSPYTLHYHYSEDHRHVYMLGVERQRADGYLAGASWFRNSFGQPSAYVYLGKRFSNFTVYAPLFAQLTGGILYGYRPPFEDKVPLNYKGFSPGAVVSVGWQFTPTLSTQLNFLGNSALMLQFSADFR